MTKAISKNELKAIERKISNQQIKDCHNFLLFAGHAHSGHSIIGAILDAHPQIAISNEVNIPKLVKDTPTISREMILKSTYFQTLKENNLWHNTEYKYKVNNSFQGAAKFPKVIGDKKGGGGTRVIRNNPWVLNQLKSLFGPQLKFIHVIRKPIDIIAAYAYYWKEPIGQNHLNRYLENLEATLTIKAQLKKSQWLTINQSSFLKEPSTELARIFDFLNVPFSSQQLTDYTSIVKSDIQSRASLYDIKPSFLNQVHTEVSQLYADFEQQS